MSLIVIAVGSLKEYTTGQEVLRLPAEGQSIAQLLANLDIPSQVVAAVLVNNVLVAKSYVPRDGDEIRLISLAGGG